MNKQVIHIQTLIQENSRLNIKLHSDIGKTKNYSESFRYNCFLN